MSIALLGSRNCGWLALQSATTYLLGWQVQCSALIDSCCTLSFPPLIGSLCIIQFNGLLVRLNYMGWYSLRDSPFLDDFTEWFTLCSKIQPYLQARLLKMSKMHVIFQLKDHWIMHPIVFFLTQEPRTRLHFVVVFMHVMLVWLPVWHTSDHPSLFIN